MTPPPVDGADAAAAKTNAADASPTPGVVPIPSASTTQSTPRSRREARLAGVERPESNATGSNSDTTDARKKSDTHETDAHEVASSAAAYRRASTDVISAPIDAVPSRDDVTVSRAEAAVPSASSTPAPITQGRRAARAAAAAIAAASLSDAPVVPAAEAAAIPAPAPAPTETSPAGTAGTAAVAANSVAALRPHSQKLGRRAAPSNTDAIEKPAGGRRAIVSVSTTAMPIDDEAAAISGNAAAVISGNAAAAPSAPSNESSTPAPVSKPVSRRTLRAAAIDPDTTVTSPEAGATASGSSDGAPGGSTSKPTSGAGGSKTGRRGIRANIAKGGFSALALIFATGIAVATSMPASALHAASNNSSESILADFAPSTPGQQLTTSADSAASSISRDGYSVRDTAALKAAGFRLADTFTNNPNGTIQWPFPVGVPISDGFGPRESPGGIGSTDHKGVDFTPGQGTPIQSIADGVVSTVEPYDNSGLGVHVIVDHVINGQMVQSVYGHMIVGSITVTEGQAIKVAQVVGLVGNTGASTGAHLHLEIRPDGVAVDPFAWLQANAN